MVVEQAMGRCGSCSSLLAPVLQEVVQELPALDDKTRAGYGSSQGARQRGAVLSVCGEKDVLGCDFNMVSVRYHSVRILYVATVRPFGTGMFYHNG